MSVWQLRLIGLGLGLALGALLWRLGDMHGQHKAELACEKANTAAAVAAIDQWKAAADDQRRLDAAARLSDAAASAKATDAATAVADRFAAMRIAVVKIAPTGACKLSKEWVDAFNGAK